MLKRNIQINFRVNAEEQEQIKAKAEKSGLSVAQYLRSLIHGYAPKEQPAAGYCAMMRELYRILYEVQQIAAFAEATDSEYKDECKQYVEDAKDAIISIQKAVLLPEKIDGDDSDMGG